MEAVLEAIPDFGGVSVIIPARNEEEFVIRTLRGVYFFLEFVSKNLIQETSEQSNSHQ